jgi:hypothetical protein
MSATLSGRALLDLWDEGLAQTPGWRALALLAAGTGIAAAELATWDVGRRDRALLQMLVAWGGRHCSSRAFCPACNEAVQVDFDVAVMSATASPAPTAVIVEGVEIAWRLPTAGELAALSADLSLEEARAELLRRCLGGADLTEEATAAVLQTLAAADPLADIELCLECPACDNQWGLGFDATVFLWTLVEEMARSLLHDVHRLARAYGWTELEILALSPRRRAAYLELCEA